MNKYILKISCKDEKGLVYKISKVIFKNNLNINVNHEFVDKEYGLFFFRSEIMSESLLDEAKIISQIRAVLEDGANISFELSHKKDIVILATKEAHCLGDLLIKNYSGELNANIKCVVSNHDSLKNLVQKFDIPYHYIDTKDLSREIHEDNVIKTLSDYKFDYIILAKYMRVLTPKFVGEYSGKIINIHHSFLPAFIGANPYKQAYERGVKIIGATAHFVSNELDEGPIIAQDVATINHEMIWQQLRDTGRYLEKNVLSKAVDMLLDDRVFVYHNKTVVF
ncbi:MAG: formyltetrahydrofolate deformylase [Campylobacter sp.]|nr:formyltetrahydrofolate deformylase [Campylobacter sp.]